MSGRHRFIVCPTPLLKVKMENRRLFTGLLIINFCITLGYGLADAFFSLYVFELGARGILLGLPIAFYSLAKIFISVPAGELPFKFGNRNILFFSLSLFCCVSLGYLVFHSLCAVIVLRVIQGAACALFRSVMLAFIGRTVCREKYAEVSGTVDMSFYGALGIGPLVGGFVRNIYGFEGVFILLTVLCLAALAAAFLYVEKYDGVKGVAYYKPAKGGFSIRKSYIGLLFFIFSRGLGISALTAFLPLFLEKDLALDTVRTGLVLCISTIFMTFGIRPLSRLCVYFSKTHLIAVGGLGASVMYMLVPKAAMFVSVLPICALVGLFGALSQPACTASLLEEAEKSDFGRSIGYFNLVMNLGFASGPVAGALIYGKLGIESVFVAAGAAGLAGVFAFIFCAKEKADYHGEAYAPPEGRAWIK